MSTDLALTLPRDCCVAIHIHLSSQCSGLLISDREPQRSLSHRAAGRGQRKEAGHLSSAKSKLFYLHYGVVAE